MTPKRAWFTDVHAAENGPPASQSLLPVTALALYVRLSAFLCVGGGGMPSLPWTHLSSLELSPQPGALFIEANNSPGNNEEAAGKSYGLIKLRPSSLPLPTLGL